MACSRCLLVAPDADISVAAARDAWMDDGAMEAVYI